MADSNKTPSVDPSIYERVPDLTEEAAYYNKDPLLPLMKKYLDIDPETARKPPHRILEIASGSGLHSVFFSNELKSGIERWQPTEYDPAMIERMKTVIGEGCPTPEKGSEIVAKPVVLDVSSSVHWDAVRSANPVLENGGHFTAAFVVNIIHIAPWQNTLDMFANVGAVLAKGSLFIVYGPFLKDNKFTTKGNEEFDQWLKETKDPSFGLRDIEEVRGVAKERGGLELVAVEDMPYDNFTLVFAKK